MRTMSPLKTKNELLAIPPQSGFQPESENQSKQSLLLEDAQVPQVQVQYCYRYSFDSTALQNHLLMWEGLICLRWTSQPQDFLYHPHHIPSQLTISSFSMRKYNSWKVQTAFQMPKPIRCSSNNYSTESKSPKSRKTTTIFISRLPLTEQI